MKVHRWRDIRNAGGKISEKRLAEIDAAVAEEARSFRELREALGITQTELAKLANMTQSEVSKFETREDHRIERMREMVEALGGKLEVIAVLGDRRVRVA
jgi:predicted transcriptional regulator